MRKIRAVTAAALAACLGQACASMTGDTVGQVAAGTVPCHVAQLAEEVRCGVHRVPESRLAPNGRTVDVHFAVLPAIRRSTASDALVVLAGGPGQGARDFADAAARYFRTIRRSRDILLIDLRGTGASNRFSCRSPVDELDALGDHRWLERALPECIRAFNGDPRLYTHAEALSDVDDIRERLGYSEINLWGGSWGTRAALLYALRYPGRVRTLVLDGAVPLTMEFPTSASRDAQSALDLLIKECRRDGACQSRYGDAGALIGELDRRLGSGPLTGRLAHPRTGQPISIALRRDEVFDAIRGALYVPQDAVGVLHLVRRALDGDLAPLVAQAIRTATWSTDEMAIGATLAILCSEDLPKVTMADFGIEVRGSVFGSAYGDVWRRRCASWLRGPAIPFAPGARSAVPALILSGAHDPVTPPRWGERMALHFTTHQHVVVPGAAHNASFTGCMPDLIAAFIAGGGRPVEASCARQTVWPGIVLGTDGPRR